MKTFINRLTKPLLFLLTLTLFVTSCSEESVDTQEPQAAVFEESPLLSFDAFDTMTATKLDGELDTEESTTSRNLKDRIAREKRFYDFNAEVLEGPDAGAALAGELELAFTFYHANFTVVRGTLDLGDGNGVRVRGVLISDGVAYLIFRVPGVGTVFGIGEIADNGDLRGSFRLFNRNGRSFGEWTATLTGVTFPDKTIVDIAVEDGRFTTLVSALEAADLVTTLQGDGPFTVFAPTDDAFAALDEIPSGETLTEVLLYHVASGRNNIQDLLNQETLTMLQGEDISVRINENNEIVINNTVKLLQANIGASNGVIQVIDAVLIPPSLQPLPSIVELAIATPELSTLVEALQAADLVETLQGEGPFTVFAPTNDAFAALDAIPEGDALKEVLLYHVAAGKFFAEDVIAAGEVETIQGQTVSVEVVDGDVILNGNVKVIMADIEASNGVVHIIDAVLLPLPSIVDIAIATPELSTLVEALQAADLVETLQGDGPFTVFAPTNDAFAALDSIPEGEALVDVLLYHVASGQFFAEDVIAAGEVTTIQGETVTVEVIDGDVILNGSVKVIMADVEASNGVVHVINAVLIPSGS